MEIRIAKTREEIAFCKEVILEFRQNLKEETYLEQVYDMIHNGGFHLAYIPNEDNTKAIAFTGYRKMQMLRTGWIIYIDDLFTAPVGRGKGCAGALLDHVYGEAKNAGYMTVHLDSGFKLFDAHRLYLNKGYVLACHHFAKRIV